MNDKENDTIFSKIEQLDLAFQPMIEVTTAGHDIKAYEILLRYQDGDYFPFQVFEELTATENNCNLLNQWYEKKLCYCLKAYPETHFSLNIDLQQLLYPSTWDLLKVFSRYNQRLSIELTEFYQVSNVEVKDLFYNAMAYIHELGLQVAFDDVGNGQHSIAFVTKHIHLVNRCKLSLLHFKHLEIETMELLIDLWVRVVKELNSQLVVEGVEDEETAKMLIKKGVFNQQGYYWSAPIK